MARSSSIPAPGAPLQRLELLSAADLRRTLKRLASQVLEGVICGHPIDRGSLDPTFHRDDLERIGTRLVEATSLPGGLDGRQVVLVDDVIFTGRTVRAALEALQEWGRPQRVFLLVMVDRGHRELPIQPDFCGRVVPTSRQESIALCLEAIDGEEGVFLLKP
jgi:pyrimidine operon attenuation protein/uracil phosphoribosyltransferase